MHVHVLWIYVLKIWYLVLSFRRWALMPYLSEYRMISFKFWSTMSFRLFYRVCMYTYRMNESSFKSWIISFIIYSFGTSTHNQKNIKFNVIIYLFNFNSLYLRQELVWAIKHFLCILTNFNLHRNKTFLIIFMRDLKLPLCTGARKGSQYPLLVVRSDWKGSSAGLTTSLRKKFLCYKIHRKYIQYNHLYFFLLIHYFR